MSEEVKEAPAGKKKGKMPVILALVAVLGGGGFFAMKMKSGPPKKVEIKAGAPEPIDKEFLINLASPNNYLRTEVTLEVRDGFKKEALDAAMPEIRGCIIQIFRSKTVQQVGASETESLKKEIATAINNILVHQMNEEEKKAQKDFEKEAKGEKDDEKDDSKKKDSDKSDSGTSSSNGWVCPAGPILDIDFTSFTTQ